MTRRRRILLATVAAGSLLATPAFAIFGLGDIVFDPTATTHLIQQIAQYQQMIAQEMALVNTAEATYEMAKYNLQYFSFKRLWQIHGVMMLPTQVRTLYGETAAWATAMNTGAPGAVTGAWTAATLPVQNGQFLASQQLGNSSHLATLAAVESQDAAGQNALATIGAIRSQADINKPAIDALEQRALSTDPADNTEIAQLNLMNAAAIQNMRTAQGTQALLSEALEHQISADLDRRNAQAEMLNIYTTATDSKTAQPSDWGNTAATFTGYDPQ